MGDVIPRSRTNIGVWDVVKAGWHVTRDQYALLLGVTLMGMLVANLAPLGILLGPMLCGIHMCYLDKIDGRRAEFDTLFRGFNHFLPSLVATIIMMLIQSVAGLIFGAIAVAFTAYVLTKGGVDALGTMGGSLITVWVCLYVLAALVIINIYFFFMYAYLLIPDRHMTGWQSLRESAKAVWRHLGRLVGIAMLATALPTVGFAFVYAVAFLIFGLTLMVFALTTLVCTVLCFFALPPFFGAITVAYREIFPLETSDYYPVKRTEHGTIPSH